MSNTVLLTVAQARILRYAADFPGGIRCHGEQVTDATLLVRRGLVRWLNESDPTCCTVVATCLGAATAQTEESHGP